MKFLIASDIHGSYAWCKKLITVFEESKADKLILLGDLLYHGPRNDLPLEYNPKKVIPLLSEYKDKIIAVRGNCDAEVDQMVLPFPIMDTSTKIFIDNKVWFLTHGHLIDEATTLKGFDVFMQGHTHIPVLKKRENTIILNPGSISIPKANSSEGYALYSDGVFTLNTFSGEIISSLSWE